MFSYDWNVKWGSQDMYITGCSDTHTQTSNRRAYVEVRGPKKRGFLNQECSHWAGSFYTFLLNSLQRRLRGHFEVLDLARDLVAARYHVEVVHVRVSGHKVRVTSLGVLLNGSPSVGVYGGPCW